MEHAAFVGVAVAGTLCVAVMVLTIYVLVMFSDGLRELIEKPRETVVTVLMALLSLLIAATGWWGSLSTSTSWNVWVDVIAVLAGSATSTIFMGIVIGLNWLFGTDT